jgi:hypothetical protein
VKGVRRENLDQNEISAQEILEVAGRLGVGMLAGPTGEERRIGLAQCRDLRLWMIEVAARIEIEYAAKPNKADAKLACHANVLREESGTRRSPRVKSGWQRLQLRRQTVERRADFRP